MLAEDDDRVEIVESVRDRLPALGSIIMMDDAGLAELVTDACSRELVERLLVEQCDRFGVVRDAARELADRLAVEEAERQVLDRVRQIGLHTADVFFATQ